MFIHSDFEPLFEGNYKKLYNEVLPMQTRPHEQSIAYFASFNKDTSVPVLLNMLSEAASFLKNVKVGIGDINGVFILRPSSSGEGYFAITFAGKNTRSSENEVFHCAFQYQKDGSITCDSGRDGIVNKDQQFGNFQEVLTYFQQGRGFIPVTNAHDKEDYQCTDKDSIKYLSCKQSFYAKLKSGALDAPKMDESKESLDSPQLAHCRKLIGFYRKYEQCLRMDIKKWIDSCILQKKITDPSTNPLIRPFVPKEQRKFPPKNVDLHVDTTSLTSVRQVTQQDLNYWRSFYDYVREIEKILGKKPQELEQEIYNLEQETMYYFNIANNGTAQDINEHRIPEPHPLVSDAFLKGQQSAPSDEKAIVAFCADHNIVIAAPISSVPTSSEPSSSSSHRSRYRYKTELNDAQKQQMLKASKELSAEWSAKLEKDLEYVKEFYLPSRAAQMTSGIAVSEDGATGVRKMGSFATETMVAQEQAVHRPAPAARYNARV